MWFIIILVSLFNFVHCDVSHLFKTFSGYDENHIGYNYDPPLGPATILFPQTTQSPFQLPEIIVNQAIIPSSNVYLPPSSPTLTDTIPVQPPLADKPVNNYLPPDNSYLPPPSTTHSNVYIPPSRPTITITQEVFHDDGYHYDPPSAKLRLAKNQFLQSVPSEPLKIEMNDLRCMFNRNNGYFKASLNLLNQTNVNPVIDIDIIDEKCNIHRTKTKFSLDIQANDFKNCGIYACSDKELCIRLRFQTIVGMKSATDALLTLQCKLQEKIAIKTHAVRFGVANTEAQERHSSVVAHGGVQQPFRTHLELFRQSSPGAKDFIKVLEPGSIVALGEELMLRVQVKAGDGWNQSRLADVSMQRVTQNGKVLNSANLINGNGCVNPNMLSICPNPSQFEPPFGHRIAFRAVMFQGMKNGDEMVMSVRVVACIDPNDCLERSNYCNNQNIHTRLKRSDDRKSNLNDTIQNETFMEISKISFRVGMPNVHIDQITKTKETHKLIVGVVLTATIMFILAMILFSVIIINRQILPRHTIWAKN